MALKTSTGKLYMLFSACFPNNEDVKKILLIERIMETEKYRSLLTYAPMAAYVRNYMDKKHFRNMSYDELCELEKTIPIIQETVELLIKSTQYSNAWELLPDDRPNFMNYDSVNNLKNKLSNEVLGRNVTNIDQSNFMDIFSDDLINSVDEVMGEFTIEQMKNPEDEIKKTLSDKLYCIPYKEIEERQRQIELAVAEINQLEINSKIVKRKIFGRKLWVVALTVVFYFCVMVSGTVYSTGLIIFTLGLIIIDILYLIMG